MVERDASGRLVITMNHFAFLGSLCAIIGVSASGIILVTSAYNTLNSAQAAEHTTLTEHREDLGRVWATIAEMQKTVVADREMMLQGVVEQKGRIDGVTENVHSLQIAIVQQSGKIDQLIEDIGNVKASAARIEARIEPRQQEH